MKLVRKQFLIVSTMMIVTILVLLAMIYFATPVYYNQVRQDQLKQEYLSLVEQLDGLPEEEIIRKVEKKDKEHDNLFINLFYGTGELIYPAISEEQLSKEGQVYLEKGDFDQAGAWSKVITSKEGTDLILQGEYAFHSLSYISQGLVTFYPFILVLIVLLTSSVAFIYSHLSNKRITAISETARQMQELKEGIACQIIGRDEVARLAEDVNHLYDKLLSSIKELESENERALTREKQKSEFLRMTSHELKTPIASMLGLVEGMLYNVGEFKDHETYLKKCKDILTEQAQLVQSILDATNAEMLRSANQESFRLDVLLAEHLQSYTVLSDIHHYQLSTDLHPTEITASKLFLLKALKNLLDNVFRYTTPGGFIRIRLSQRCLTIDNQAEHLLSPEELEQIFHPFYRPDFSRNRKDGGTGIGLYLVQQILDSHGFSYSFEAVEDSFMRFTIRFP